MARASQVPLRWADPRAALVPRSKEALAQAGTLLGEAAHGQLVTDRRDLDYLRVFASRPTVVGRTLGDLDLPGEKASVLVQVRRGDTEILPRPDLVLESAATLHR